MNVVDSSGWIEYLTEGPTATEFAAPFVDVEELVVPSISILEVSKWVRRNAGLRQAAQAVALMQQGRVADLDVEIAVRAAGLALDVGLPLADSVILATARLHGATLWTQDAHFADIPDVRYFPKR